jgi:hypothetical protein
MHEMQRLSDSEQGSHREHDFSTDAMLEVRQDNAQADTPTQEAQACKPESLTRRPDPRPCPCCKKQAIVKWHQPALMPGRPGFTMMHCEDSACKLYEVTQVETVYFPETPEQVEYHQQWLKTWGVTESEQTDE